jgi:S-formylglutathione hydrolase FrmB
MRSMTRIALIALVLAAVAPACAFSQYGNVNGKDKGKDEFDIVGLARRLKGRLVDHTSNHGQDHRIWSRSLHQWRDLYVYLPPGYDPHERYPIVIYMHPFAYDERTFLRLVTHIDTAIAGGILPPLIVAAPDGSLDGMGCLERPGSFFLNSGAGNYEDFLLQDMWDFVCKNYPIRPERNAHVLAGISMGGFAAFNQGLRHRDAFGIVAGIHPPLNLRWADVDGNPRAKFDPRRWGWRTGFDDPHEVLATMAGGIAKVRMGKVIRPVFGEGDDALLAISGNNPLELVIKTGLKNGELSMFVGYGGRDEFNIDAQVDSFLYYCKFRGLGIAVAFEPDGHHDGITALKFLPAMFRWLGPQLEPYSPGRCSSPCLP